MRTSEIIRLAFEQGQGIVRLAPNWVPRSFCVPGRRLKLHPDDYYALGGARGGIDERWFASTTPADNGPLTGQHEGLSQIVFEDGATHQALFAEAQPQTTSPLGSPTAVSPRLPAFTADRIRELWEAQRAREVVRAHQRRTRVQQRVAQELFDAGAQQLGLF